MHRRLAPAALAVLLAQSISAHCQTTVRDEAAVIVTAMRQPMRANELLNDVTVVDRDEIEKAGPVTLPEFLATQPGIQFTENGSPGATSSVLLRGASAGHTLVLIDGQRVGSATLGTVSWSRLPLAQIERIEILRGPASSLYGSDAIGGVVQIFTRKGEGPPRVDAEAGVGSHGTRLARAGVGAGDNGLHYRIDAADFRTDGFNSVRNPRNTAFNPDPDGFHDRSLAAALSYDLAPGHEIGANVFYSEGTNRYDTGYSAASAARNYENAVTLQSQAAYLKNRIAPGWTSTLRAGRAIDDATNTANAATVSVFRTDQDQLSWQHDVRLPVGSLVLGWEKLTQKIGGSSDYSLKERDIESWLAGWNGRIGGHRLQANLRQDHNSQFGGRNTGALAWGYQLDEAWRVQAAYGTAFKAPTFNDLYYPLSYGYVGNPGLRPEFARNRELAAHYEAGGHHASATWFRNRVSDLISWSGVTSPVNIGSAQLEGLTVAYRGHLAGFDADGSIDVLDAQDAATGRRLGRRARETMRAALGRTVGPWQWRTEFQAVGRRYDDDANRRPLGGFGLLNLQASYALDRTWSAFARINNLFDKKYELVADYATPGASVFIGIRYAPK